MTLLDRLICFAGFFAFIAVALIIGLAHDNYVMANGPMPTWAFICVITCIIGSFVLAIGSMILAAKD